MYIYCLPIKVIVLHTRVAFSFTVFKVTCAFCIPQFPFEFECEWPNGNSAIHKSFKLPFSHSHSKNINIFYFEMSGQIAIQPFSIKKGVKISEQPNGNSAIYKSFRSSYSNANRI